MITELDMTVNRSAPPMVRVLQGDCLAVLPTLEAESVQCCVTSPPYWGLRDYQTASWEGGDAGCDHLEIVIGIGVSNTLGPNGHLPLTNAGSVGRKMQYRDKCAKCGARRIDAQLGLEPTPGEYVANLVRVFRAVWRVLRDDGTLWVNLGDSYATQGGRGEARMAELGKPSPFAKTVALARGSSSGTKTGSGLKPKDLCMIPARVALALQADGWWLRQDIIWSKKAPMPESVTDRCTRSHEYMFLLTKRANYYFDTGAIAEPAAYMVAPNARVTGDYQRDSGRNDGGKHRSGGFIGSTMRNKRSVWHLGPSPFSEAHFATFPPDLIKPCILAGSRVGDTVLDPFAGSGTTGKVATEYGRKSVLIELNPAYVAMIHARTNVTAGML